MGLPKFFWAENTLYPAGANPWSGQPTKVAPSAQSQQQGFSPENPAGAQEINYVLNAAAQNASLGANLQAINWTPQSLVSWTALGSPRTCEGIAYSSFNKCWFALINNKLNNLIYMYQSFDLSVWTNLGQIASLTTASNEIVGGLICSPITNTVVAMGGQNASNVAFIACAGSGAPSQLTTALGAVAGATSAYAKKSGIWFNSIFLWFTELGSDESTIISLPDNGSTTFTKQSFAGTSNPQAPLISAASPTCAIAIGIASAGFNSLYFYTTNGTSFSVQNTPNSASGGHEMPRAITWAADQGLFFVITQNFSSPAGVHHVYSSPDGLTWTHVSDFTLALLGSSLSLADVEASGPVLVGSYSCTPGSSTSARIVFSPDAGVSWYQAPDYVDQPNDVSSSNVTANWTIAAQVVQSGDRFLLNTELGLRASIRGYLGGGTKI